MKNGNGFSLFELLIYMVCVLFLLSGISVVTINLVGSFKRVYALDHVLQLWSACSLCAKDAALCVSPASVRVLPDGISWRIRTPKSGERSVVWRLHNNQIKRCAARCSCVAQSVASFSCNCVHRDGRVCGMWVTLASSCSSVQIRRFIRFAVPYCQERQCIY